MKNVILAVLLCAAVLALSACGTKADSDAAQSGAQPGNALAEESEAAIDLDLSVLSGTVVYSQVYAMLEDPEAYMGQRVKMKGNFSYFQDPDTKQEYFAAIIADAAACCAQGIEFVWAGEHAYPEDYPELDTEVTVTGRFDTYVENGYTYVQLIDADVRWEA